MNKIHDISNAKLFAIGNNDSNWDYYIDKPWNDNPDKWAIWFIAKPNSGALDGYMGDIQHIKKLIRQGYWHNEFTEFGKTVMGLA